MGFVILINTGFHIAYHFISRAPAAFVARFRRGSTMANIYKAFSQFMGILALLGAVLVTSIVIYESATSGEYEDLSVILVMTGLFLGAVKLFENLET